MNVSNKSVLITGAAAGIGRASALAMADENAKLILLDVDESGLHELANYLQNNGHDATAYVCDLSRSPDIDRTLRQIESEQGGVDILINNAGVAYYGDTWAMSDEQWDQLLAVNLLAPVQIIRRLLPSMRQRESAHIVNVSSVAGLAGFKRTAAYSLTKFGLVGLSESLRMELARDGIGVSAVCPGFVQTKLYQSMTAGRTGNKYRKWMTIHPDAVASRVVRAVKKNQPLVVVGLVAQLVWRLKRTSPWIFTKTFGGYRRARVKPQPLAIAEIEHPHCKAA